MMGAANARIRVDAAAASWRGDTRRVKSAKAITTELCELSRM